MSFIGHRPKFPRFICRLFICRFRPLVQIIILFTPHFTGGQHLSNEESGNPIKKRFISSDANGYRRHEISDMRI